jgi:mannose-6-phosphate isomerase-like protein (cupin superfamily)
MEKYTEDRPWGQFEQFCLNEKCTTKIISVNPNAKLSLQYHKNRDEFWRVIFGEGIIVLGDKEHIAKEGDEFFIPRGTLHRIKTGDGHMKMLEISFGHFDENDIVRIEDLYKRS